MGFILSYEITSQCTCELLQPIFVWHGDVGVHWDTQGGVHWDAVPMDTDSVYACQPI